MYACIGVMPIMSASSFSSLLETISRLFIWLGVALHIGHVAAAFVLVTALYSKVIESPSDTTSLWREGVDRIES